MQLSCNWPIYHSCKYNFEGYDVISDDETELFSDAGARSEEDTFGTGIIDGVEVKSGNTFGTVSIDGSLKLINSITYLRGYLQEYPILYKHR